MIRILFFIIVASFIGYGVGYWGVMASQHLKKLLSVKQKPALIYPFYETAAQIEDHWHDGNRIGLCGYCGMDDAPIVVGYKDPNHKNKCKWCAELSNLTWHRKNWRSMPVRRPPQPPPGNGGGSPPAHDVEGGFVPSYLRKECPEVHDLKVRAIDALNSLKYETSELHAIDADETIIYRGDGRAIRRIKTYPNSR